MSKADDLPKGFTPISGKRNPPKGDQRYHIMLRCGFIDTKHSYTADQLVWIHDGGSGDIIAVRKV